MSEDDIVWVWHIQIGERGELLIEEPQRVLVRFGTRSVWLRRSQILRNEPVYARPA